MRFVTVLAVLTILNNFLFAQWEQTTCPVSGGVYSIVVSGNNIYAGTAENGIYKSSDNGLSWEQANTGLSNFTNVKALIIKANQSGGTEILAGTSGGVYVSSNEGVSWKLLTSGISDVTTLAIKDSIVFAGTVFKGIYCSTNNGKNWKAINNGLTDYSFTSIIVNGSNIMAVSYNNIFRSDDNGLNWTEIDNGIPEERSIYTLAINKDTMYLSLNANEIINGERNSFAAVYISTDNGMNWNILSRTLYGEDFPALISSFIFIENKILAATDGFSFTGGVFLSKNNGLKWIPVNQGFPEYIVIYDMVIKGNEIFLGAKDGIWRRPVSELVNDIVRPIVVDHSQWFPPAEVQYGNTCTIFATIYNLKSYLWNKKFNRDPHLPENQFSPYFLFNQMYDPASGLLGGQMHEIYPLMANQGCLTLDKYPLNVQTFPDLELREAGLSYRSSGLTSLRVSFPDSFTTSNVLSALKDSLIKGTCFTIGLPVYGYMHSLYNQRYAVYSCYKDISQDSILVGHEVTVVGYNDNIKTAQGRGAFKALNSWGPTFGDMGFFFIDYNWFYYAYWRGEQVNFLQEKFDYYPELTLNFNISMEMDELYRKKNLFADTVFFYGGRRIDNQVNNQNYVNFLQLRKVNGEIVPAIVKDKTYNNLLFLPPYSPDGNYQILTDLTDYVKAGDFKSLELLVYDPISVSYTGIMPDSYGNYNGEASLLYTYTRQPQTQVYNPYIKFLNNDKRITGRITDLPDTTVTCLDYYSTELMTQLNPFTYLAVYVKQSISTLKRKLITFNIADTSAVSVKPESINLTYSLNQNYPNPFNPATTISYSIPAAGLVTLRLYDVLGKEIASLVNEEKTAGNYEIEFDGNNLASGIYFYTLEANGYVKTKKMVLLR